MAEYVWLIPALPLVGFVIQLVFGRRLGDPVAGYVAAAMVFGSFAAGVGVWLDLLGRPEADRSEVVTLFSWMPVGDLGVDMALLADPLSVAMVLFVTGIAGLIHLFAVGYMHGDPKFSKFFMYLNLFVTAMVVLVLGENLLVTFLGWEGVGVCSYFLISFWHTRDSAATAGKKAFITNRVGDLGVMLAMFLTFGAVGSLSYSALNSAAESGALATSTATAIALLLFLGAAGKSAQLPLYFWLPDAMEGPTPVSALIHAATMVTAGVFVLVRVNPVIASAEPWATSTIAWIGVITALFAATIAVAQTDIKKVLAYSTVSQLGLMVLAVGVGGYAAAIFHMITHAAFKALLFLGSGSVIHGMHEEQDMRRMGALRVLMPVTAATFIIGWLAIAGVPPFSGFWSKDEILLFTAARSPVLYVLALATALLTAFYMTRQVIMVFFGEARWESHAEDHGAHGEFKPHESPPIMLVPLVVLAGLAAVLGVIQLPSLGFIPTGWRYHLEHWLHPIIEFGEADIKSTGAYSNMGLLALLAIAVALVGIAVAYLVYQRQSVRPVEPQVLAEGWYYDRSVTRFMGGPGRAAFEATADFDKRVVDGAVTGTATGVLALGRNLRRTQTGYVRGYAGLIGIGVVALLIWFVLVRGIG
jgi:NADH-quinone oxidoreductase subunit L